MRPKPTDPMLLVTLREKRRMAVANARRARREAAEALHQRLQRFGPTVLNAEDLPVVLEALRQQVLKES